MTTESRTNYPNGRFHIEFTTGSTYGDRCASITKQGDSQFLAIFGTAARNWNGGFQFDVSAVQPSRCYKTEAGARKAVSAWLAL